MNGDSNEWRERKNLQQSYIPQCVSCSDEVVIHHIESQVDSKYRGLIGILGADISWICQFQGSYCPDTHHRDISMSTNDSTIAIEN